MTCSKGRSRNSTGSRGSPGRDKGAVVQAVSDVEVEVPVEVGLVVSAPVREAQVPDPAVSVPAAQVPDPVV